jgi:hypothetical protein
MTVPISAFQRSQVQAYAEGNMTARIQVLRGQLGAFDEATGRVGGLSGAKVVYAGKARIRTVGGAGVVSVGAGEIDTPQVIISIPMDAPLPHRDDVVRVLRAEADGDLAARIFRVLDVDGGSLFGDARRLTCVGWFNSRQWGPQS